MCQEAGVGKGLRQYIRDFHVVGEYLEYVKKSANDVEENTVAAVCPNSHYKRIDSWPFATEYLHDCIHVSIPASLSFGHICNCETYQPLR